jgi:hypothetical protein
MYKVQDSSVLILISMLVIKQRSVSTSAFFRYVRKAARSPARMDPASPPSVPNPEEVINDYVDRRD